MTDMRTDKKPEENKQTMEQQQQDQQEHIMGLEHVRSMEYYIGNSMPVVPVLDDINLDMYAGESWAICASRVFTIAVMLGIIGNITPFDTGYASLATNNLPREKQKLLPDIFYIGSDDMLYDDMNVLQFLSFATQKAKKLGHLGAAASQKHILDFLVESDLSYISMSQIQTLSMEEKLLITIICAYYSESKLVVINQPNMQMLGRLRGSFKTIVSAMREQMQCIVFGTMEDFDLIEAAASHIAFIHNGQIAYAGEVDGFKEQYDRVSFALTARHPSYVYEKLQTIMPEYDIHMVNDKIMLYGFAKTTEEMEIAYLYSKIREAELWVEQVYVNEKSVENAVREVKRANNIPL